MSIKIRALWKTTSKMGYQHKISQFPPKQFPADLLQNILIKQRIMSLWGICKPLTVRQKPCLDSEFIVVKCYVVFHLSFHESVHFTYWFFERWQGLTLPTKSSMIYCATVYCSAIPEAVMVDVGWVTIKTSISTSHLVWDSSRQDAFFLKMETFSDVIQLSFSAISP